MADYDVPSSCNRCTGDNEFISPSYDESLLMETKTKCKNCGFYDYWAYGHFESGADRIGKCKTYGFDDEGMYYEE